MKGKKPEFQPTISQIKFLRENLGLMSKTQLARKLYITRNQLDAFVFKHKLEPTERNLKAKDVQYYRVPVNCKSGKPTFLLVEKGADIDAAKKKFYEKENSTEKRKYPWNS